MSGAGAGFARGTPILVYLHTPRERIFGVLEALLPAGVAVREGQVTDADPSADQDAAGDARRSTLIGTVDTRT